MSCGSANVETGWGCDELFEVDVTVKARRSLSPKPVSMVRSAVLELRRDHAGLRS